MPPTILKKVIASPRTMAARKTVTTGSNVESMEAFAGPIRLRPARNVTMPSTVEIRAIAIIEIHPAIVAGHCPPFTETSPQDTTPAETTITVEDESISFPDDFTSDYNIN